jgi:hypothetical protein
MPIYSLQTNYETHSGWRYNEDAFLRPIAGAHSEGQSTYLILAGRPPPCPARPAQRSAGEAVLDGASLISDPLAKLNNNPIAVTVRKVRPHDQAMRIHDRKATVLPVDILLTSPSLVYMQ